MGLSLKPQQPDAKCIYDELRKTPPKSVLQQDEVIYLRSSGNRRQGVLETILQRGKATRVLSRHAFYKLAILAMVLAISIITKSFAPLPS
ncbi:hypothetical protein ACQRIT_003721 [Beauveria bassiana]